MVLVSAATIFNYCERGRDASFWAEPLNALSNGAFVMAGVYALTIFSRQRRDQRSLAPAFFAVLMIVVGIGSFLFHTYATPWAATADVAPIGIFMLAYFAYALRIFLRWHVLAVMAALGAFAAALYSAGDFTCSGDLLPATAAAGRPCFNGSLAYVPALLSMLFIGGALVAQRHPAGRRVLMAGLIFLVSLTARTLDFELCVASKVLGAVRGTHMLWHILNAVTLFLLTTAAIWHGNVSTESASGEKGRR